MAAGQFDPTSFKRLSYKLLRQLLQLQQQHRVQQHQQVQLAAQVQAMVELHHQVESRPTWIGPNC
jgi:hypothetical protein